MFTWVFKLFSSVGRLIKPAISQLATDAGEYVLNLAVDAVEEVEQSGLKGGDKYEAAYKIIKLGLEESAVNVKDSLVNYAIETAVQRLENLVE